MLPIRDSFQTKRHKQTESKVMEKILHENGNKKVGEATLISDQIDFKMKTIT
mgnify:CR=1 FL=1